MCCKSVVYPLVLFLAICLNAFNCLANEEVRFEETHEYVINSNLKGYQIHSVIDGRTDDLDGTVAIFHDELRKVKFTSVLYENAKGKWVKLKTDDLHSTSVPSRSFYSGSKAYLLHFPEGVNYKVTFTTTVPNTLLLTALPLQPFIRTYSLTRKIILPETCNLYFAIPDSLTYAPRQLQVDSLVANEMKTYSFESSEDIAGLRKKETAYRAPFIRTLVTHGVHKNAPLAFFNSAYQDLKGTDEVLAPETKTWLNAAVSNTANDRERVKQVFAAVQHDIGYIDLEDGYNAFVPRPANTVLFNRKGDCKDMSNLLKQCFDEIGIPAELAISSTLIHPVDMNFPTLSSGNHVICVVEINDTTFFLDATESMGPFGLPSRQIQGRQVMISSADGAQYLSVPIVDATTNTVNTVIKLTVEPDRRVSGVYSSKSNGLVAIPMRSLLTNTSMENAEKRLGERLKRQHQGLHFQKMVDSQADAQTDTVQVEFDVTGKLDIRTIGNKHFLSLGFIEDELHALLERADDKIITYHTVDRSQHVALTFPKAVTLVNGSSISDQMNGVSSNWELTQTAPNVIVAKYNYRNEHVILERSDIDSLTSLQTPKNGLNTTIIYTENE